MATYGRKQRRKRKPRQPDLPGTQNRGRGGRRKGAGRKPKGKRAGVSHKTRPFVDAAHPGHITMRVVPGIARLRKDKQHRVIRKALCAVNNRAGFQVAHYCPPERTGALQFHLAPPRAWSRRDHWYWCRDNDVVIPLAWSVASGITTPWSQH